MYQDFNTIYRKMRDGTWDHAAFKRMNRQIQDARAQWEAGEIGDQEYVLKVKTARLGWEMKQRFAATNKGLRLM
jgi:hypothetical protein